MGCPKCGARTNAEAFADCHYDDDFCPVDAGLVVLPNSLPTPDDMHPNNQNRLTAESLDWVLTIVESHPGPDPLGITAESMERARMAYARLMEYDEVEAGGVPERLTKEGLKAYFVDFLNGEKGVASAEVLSDVVMGAQLETEARVRAEVRRVIGMMDVIPSALDALALTAAESATSPQDR